MTKEGDLITFNEENFKMLQRLPVFLDHYQKLKVRCHQNPNSLVLPVINNLPSSIIIFLVLVHSVVARETVETVFAE